MSVLTGVIVASGAATEGELPDPIGVDFFAFDNAANLVVFIGWLVPILVALVTKTTATPATKAIVQLVAQALLATIGVLVAADGGFALQAWINAFLSQLVPAIALYYGLYKPTGITRKANVVTANFGIGGGRHRPDLPENRAA